MKINGLWARRALLLLCPGFVLLLTGVPASGAELILSTDIPVTVDEQSFEENDTILHDPSGFSLDISGADLGIPFGVNLTAVGASGSDLLFAVDVPTTLNGMSYSERDVLLYDGSTFSKLLDGTTAGIPAGAGINAATLLADGRIVLALDIPTTLGGSAFKANDLIQYDGATFSLYASGSQLGIPENASISAVSVNAAGEVFFALDIPGSLNGLDVTDKDVLNWSDGVVSIEFDGIQAGLPAGSAMDAFEALASADLNGDGVLDFGTDSQVFFSLFGQPVDPPGTEPDYDGDGMVGLGDYSIFLSLF